MTLTITSDELTALRGLVARAEASASDTAALQPGDLAQLNPEADKTFGGALFHVTQVAGRQVRGYLLRAHRGAAREAWLSFPPTSLERIGRAPWPQPEFAQR